MDEPVRSQEGVLRKLRGISARSQKAPTVRCDNGSKQNAHRRARGTVQPAEILPDSERRYRTLADHTYDWGAWLGVDGRPEWISPSVERVTGYTMAECLAMPDYPLPLIHEEDRDWAAASHRRAVEGQTIHDNEFRVRRKDGSVCWVELCAQPICNDQGLRVGCLTSIRDITHRKRVEEELRRTRGYFQSILDSSPDMIISADQDRRVVMFNRAAQKRLGYSADEMIGNSVQALYADPEQALQVHESVQTTGQFRGEIINRTKGGETFVAYLEASKLCDDQGRVLGVMGISSDITERKRAEQKLRESEERFRVAQDLSLDAFSILDAVRHENGSIVDFTWLYVNPKAAQILRRRPEDLVGRRLLDVLPAHKTDNDLFDRYVRVVETGQPHDQELLYESPEIRGWFRNMAVKLGDGIAVYFSDITERRRAEAERAEMLLVLKRSREDLLSILNRLQQAVIMTDGEGQITFASENCGQVLDRKAASLLGREWTAVGRFEPEDRLALAAMAKRPPGQRTKVRVRIQAEGGAPRLVDVDILDDPRDPARKVFFIYDLTEVHNLLCMLDEKRVFHGMVGQSRAILQVVQQVRDLAAADATVLIEGETGTGKELVARAIHAAGARANKLFLPVNCAGLTESLIGSQLFGHKRGAFTGAFADHRGVFETAQGGTVFLDEIGDIPPSMQTNLLRVLQEKEITRLGESLPRRVDVRVLAATHQNLDQLVREGRFRSDLLYRIRVARIAIAPLRDRRDDIPLLVETFLSEAARRNNKPVASVSEEAMRRLLEYDWPGNVRELQSAIEYATIGCKGSVIQAEALPPELNTPRSPVLASVNVEEDARTRLLAAIRAAKGSRTAAARLLGVGRATLYRRLRELRLDLDSLP